MNFSGTEARGGFFPEGGNSVLRVLWCPHTVSFLRAPTHLHPHPQSKRTLSAHPGQHFIFVDLLEDGHSKGCQQTPRCRFG